MVFSKRFIHFINVVKTGSIVKASEALNITPSAVCQGISALEKQLGVRLFKKNYPGGVLTQDGVAFYSRIEKHFKAVNTIVEEMFMHDDSLKELVVVCDGLNYPILNEGLIKSIKEKRTPNISIRCEVVQNIISDLKYDAIDMIISPSDINVDDSKLIKINLPVETLGLVAHKSLFMKYNDLKLLILNEFYLVTSSFLKHQYFLNLKRHINNIGFNLETMSVAELDIYTLLQKKLGFTFLTQRMYEHINGSDKDLVFISSPFNYFMSRKIYMKEKSRWSLQNIIEPFFIKIH